MIITKTRIYKNPLAENYYQNRFALALGARLVDDAHLTRILKKMPNIDPSSKRAYIGYYWWIADNYRELGEVKKLRSPIFDTVQNTDQAREKILVRALAPAVDDNEGGQSKAELKILSSEEGFLYSLKHDLNRQFSEDEDTPSHIKMLKEFMSVDGLLITREAATRLSHGDIDGNNIKEIFQGGA